MVEVQLVSNQGNNEDALDAADREAVETQVRYTHEEIFSMLRKATLTAVKH